MARGIAISSEVRQLIIDRVKNGKSYKEIGTDLNLSRSTVQYIVKSYKKNNSIVNNNKNKGKVSRITPREVRSLERIIKKSRRNTVRTLATMWSSSIERPIGRETTRKQLKKLNYGFYKVSNKCIQKFTFIT